MPPNRPTKSDRPMPEPTDQWVSVRDAAAALGLSEDAIRSKVKRRTLRARKGNDGRVLVLVGDQPIDRPPTIGRPLGDQPIDRPTAPTPEPRQSVTHAPETVPLSAHLATIEALQEAHRATVAAHQAAITRLRADTRINNVLACLVIAAGVAVLVISGPWWRDW